MNTSEVLNKAADLIEERGWTTGPLGWLAGVEGPICLEGGLLAATGLRVTERAGGLWDCPAYLAVQNYLGSGGRLWKFNDEPGRTVSEVIEVLRAAAVIEAAKENASEQVSA